MSAHDKLREAVARAMCLDANNGRDDAWARDGVGMRKAWLSSADAALAVMRAHCLGRVQEIHSRIHMTDSDAFAEQVRQRALVAWQLAEDCNTSAAGAVGGE